jgi:hypothetical protein
VTYYFQNELSIDAINYSSEFTVMKIVDRWYDFQNAGYIVAITVLKRKVWFDNVGRPSQESNIASLC